MKGWIRRTWLVCVVALAQGVPAAYASGGTITFVGAIMAPTCSTTDARIEGVANASASHASNSRFVCEDRNTTFDPAQSFTLNVTTIQASGMADDRVLSYFAGYAKAAGSDEAAVKLVTQTFQ
ncbi:hypothetical protein [Dyella sp. Tek66A03]|uniref:hypothetical protein n=1 Tax=Dyella sp. Tek66A03 TaxID=3458298 RepID=UPI00403E800A